MNYSIGDFLIQIKNGYQARKKEIQVPFSNNKLTIGKILEKEGYVGSVKELKNGNKRMISVSLKYENKNPAIEDIKLVSKPSVHHYVNKAQIKKTALQHGIGILSTSRGMMTTASALKEGVGGELIAKVF